MTMYQVLIGGAGVIALLLAGTMLLPRTVHIERQAKMDSSMADVIALAASNEGYQQFNPYLTADPNLKISTFGPDSGVGSGFNFDGKDGTGSQTVASVTDDTVHYNIDLGSMGQPTQTLHVDEIAGGVSVTWSMDADLGYNPIARVFGLFMDGMIGKTLEQGLVNLETAT